MCVSIEWHLIFLLLVTTAKHKILVPIFVSYLYGTPWKSHIHAYWRLKPPHGPTFRGSDGRSSSENMVSRSVGCISTWIQSKRKMQILITKTNLFILLVSRWTKKKHFKLAMMNFSCANRQKWRWIMWEDKKRKQPASKRMKCTQKPFTLATVIWCTFARDSRGPVYSSNPWL